MKKIFYFVILLLVSQISNSQSIKDTLVLDYATINQTIQNKVAQFGAENVLVVLDIDNTILTSEHDLGSDFWYQWQTGKLDVIPTEDQKLSSDCLFNEAIGFLYEFGSMKLTEPDVPNYIQEWQNENITVFALTSRSPNYRIATERELKRNNVDLTKTEIKTKDGNHLNFKYKLKRDLGYENGVMMTTGMDKGKMLKHILGRSGKQFKAIIFVDDTRKNLDNIKSQYTDCNDIDLTLFHYTKIEHERLKSNNNQILTKKQAKQMDKDWDALMNALELTFPNRTFQCSVN